MFFFLVFLILLVLCFFWYFRFCFFGIFGFGFLVVSREGGCYVLGFFVRAPPSGARVDTDVVEEAYLNCPKRRGRLRPLNRNTVYYSIHSMYHMSFNNTQSANIRVTNTTVDDISPVFPILWNIP